MQNLLLYTHTGARACTRYFFKYYYKLIENCEWFFLAIARFSCVFMNRKIYISNQKFILKALHDIFLTHGYILLYIYWYKCLYEACYMRARACGRYSIMISIILIHFRYSLSHNIRITRRHTQHLFIWKTIRLKFSHAYRWRCVTSLWKLGQNWPEFNPGIQFAVVFVLRGVNPIDARAWGRRFQDLICVYQESISRSVRVMQGKRECLNCPQSYTHGVVRSLSLYVW